MNRQKIHEWMSIPTPALASTLHRVEEDVREGRLPIRKLQRGQRFPDDPPWAFIRCVPEWDDPVLKKKLSGLDGNGVARESSVALVRAVGEVVERQALVARKEADRVATPETLRADGIPLVHPWQIAVPPPSLARRYPFLQVSDTTPLGWVQGWDWKEDRPVLVPAQQVYLSYLPYHKEEPVIVFPISTGAAAGGSPAQAVYKGVCEVLERDAFIIRHYLHLTPEAIEPRGEDVLNDAVETIRRYQLDVYLYLLTLDIPLPIFLALLVDRTGLGPTVMAGLGADLSPTRAAMAAIDEAMQTRFIARLAMRGWGRSWKRPAPHRLRNAMDRARYWAHPDALLDVTPMLQRTPTRSVGDLDDMRQEDDRENARILMRMLSEQNLHPIIVPLSSLAGEQRAFHVVKVLVPGTQPMYLREDIKPLVTSRLIHLSRGEYDPVGHPEQLNLNPHLFV